MAHAPDIIRLRLEPLGKSVTARRGQPVRDLLFEHGVEFPCGGRGSCRGCRVRIVAGEAEVTQADRAALTGEEIRAGWRLACHLTPERDLTLEVAQWETVILEDRVPALPAGRAGRGVAVDLGTTTIVAQSVDLGAGDVLGVRTSLNPQAAFGSDVMSRIEAAVVRGAAGELGRLARERVRQMVSELEESSGAVDEVVIAGNTVMHHLFTGRDVAGLARYPFETGHGGLVTCRAGELGWRLERDPAVHFLPCLGGFVGSDILAGILATGMHESAEPAVLVDLGTNGEIVVGNRDAMVCASTAAGPAFEGGRLSMGMRAATGAISEVRLEPGRVRCHVIGGGRPRGICGSGLVDAAAAALELGTLSPNGKLASGAWTLADPVSITQADVRQLQLAKAAIAAGIRILLGRMGLASGDVAVVHLAGAFGNYVNRESARRIGLFDFPLDRVKAAGNTALRGVRMALAAGVSDYGWLRGRITHIPLAADPEFQPVFVGAMAFPASAG